MSGAHAADQAPTQAETPPPSTVTRPGDLVPEPQTFPLHDSAFTFSDRVLPTGPVSGDQLYVFIAEDQLNKMLEQARDGGNSEVGGAILGRYCADGDLRFLLVLWAEPCHEGDRNAVSIRIPPDFWFRLDRLLSADLEGMIRLGTYHSHPGYGVWPSATDLATFQAIFRRSHHAMIIVDPKRGEIGCTFRVNGEVREPTGCIPFVHADPRALWPRRAPGPADAPPGAPPTGGEGPIETPSDEGARGDLADSAAPGPSQAAAG